MRRMIRICLVIGMAVAFLAPGLGLSGRAAAGGPASPPGVLPLGVAVNENACDPSGEPVPADPPWPSGETVVIPICGDASGLTWLDFSPPSGSVAELIAAIESPVPSIAVPDWIYAGAAFNVNNGNLEESLNNQAGNPLRLPMIDDSCIVDPGSGMHPCESGPGTGSNLWVHAIYLRTFTIASAHLTGDLTPCGDTPPCLIGTFNDLAAPFTDIDGNPFRGDIEWAFAAGITEGCSAELFCPKAPVRRDEMATFLDRMFELEPNDVDWFDDDDGNLHEDAINRVAAAGISLGCRSRAFCPNTSVTREQMAAFISRAAALTEGAGRNYFSDDDGRVLEASDDLAAAAGISNGCAAFRFCPTMAVLREQMVAFLHRVVEPIEPPPFPAP